MVVETIKIPGELCGPSNTAHGGYVCGRLAKHIEGPATVRLMMGAPLDVPLRIEASNGEVRMFDQDTLIAEARGAEMDLIPPSAPSFASAMEASKSFVAMERHPFARCFVCGPQRAPGDGMRIFPGAVQGQPLIAAPWVPNAAFAGGSDNICPEFIWAVLECTGGFAWYPQMVVLGELSGQIKSALRPGEKCIVVGWKIAAEGRKHFAGTAVFSESGDTVAVGRATWIEIPKEAFVALSRTGRRS